jgi:hypothetical protein
MSATALQRASKTQGETTGAFAARRCPGGPVSAAERASASDD